MSIDQLAEDLAILTQMPKGNLRQSANICIMKKAASGGNTSNLHTHIVNHKGEAACS